MGRGGRRWSHENRPPWRIRNHDAAAGALRRFLEGEAGGFNADPNQSVDDYLRTWPAAKALVLRSTTMAR